MGRWSSTLNRTTCRRRQIQKQGSPVMAGPFKVRTPLIQRQSVTSNKFSILFVSQITGRTQSHVINFWTGSVTINFTRIFCTITINAGIATGYGLDGPGIEFRTGEIFRTCPDRPCGPPSLLYNGYRVFPGRKSGRGVTLTPHHLLVPRSIKSRAIPLLPVWAVRLYRASVPAQGCTLLTINA